MFKEETREFINKFDKNIISIKNNERFRYATKLKYKFSELLILKNIVFEYMDNQCFDFYSSLFELTNELIIK